MRTKGAALATAMNWFSNYLIVEITPPGIEYLGWRFYLIWMFFNALFIPVRLDSVSPHPPTKQFNSLFRLCGCCIQRRQIGTNRLERPVDSD
jgi:hypothetical protein